ncbi:MAG: hypothetical protein IJS76_03440 [Pseudobutyrivibrio sp.]|nr:hypothetical protein [Pseudobutyrivibrio sp.]
MKFIKGFVALFICIGIGCGYNESASAVDSINEHSKIEVDKADNEEISGDVDNNLKREGETLEEKIKAFSGLWANDDGTNSMNIYLGDNDTWELSHTTSGNVTEIYDIDNIVDAKKEDVIPRFKDCDYWLQLSSGEFLYDIGITIQTDDKIVVRWALGVEDVLTKQN